MMTYKLFRLIDSGLYPLYVEASREMPLGKTLSANVGELYDKTHVKSRLGPLALRPGFHSCEVPFANWIGRRGPDGKLYRRPNEVWCECRVEGEQVNVPGRYGLRTLPHGWYYYRTNPRQPFPWIISDRILICRILAQSEVENICAAHGVKAQSLWKAV